ncbi:hypothetical protein FJTKL_06326 [Diaporthe vaccinii]|uniref:pectinesterase n=1 Tax=Diaporthe vaccinii TaxID=105482 RepID=A0ABR4DQ68_9PEZI
MAYNKAQQGYYGIFANSYIEGATDFIFSREDSLWITNLTIGVAGPGCITASSCTSDSSASYYVIMDSTVTSASGAAVSAGNMYLGRPWGEYARVAFQRIELLDLINSAGWRAWNDDEPRTDSVVYGEFDNTGDGTSGEREFETKLSAALDIGDILGSDYANWVEAAYI